MADGSNVGCDYERSLWPCFMSNFCTNNSATNGSCPCCAVIGPQVGVAPVRPHRPAASNGAWRFCPNQSCSVIYYLGDEVVDENEVITKVGSKASAKTTPVCYCFAHTADSLAKDLKVSGTSTAKTAIAAAVAEGFCACEHLNPSGNCCLPEIHRTLKSIAARATGHTSA